ncbi:hypothetical protein M3Y99_00042000 [Aphelenchoides fujianensis]|nr:hypothetical protein M3Y99_00042000 [Aphelenchoides fujianensis]
MVDGLELELRCVAGKWIGEDALAFGLSLVLSGGLWTSSAAARFFRCCPNGHELGATCEVECEQNAISLVGNTPATIECSKLRAGRRAELLCVPSCSTDGLSEWNVLPALRSLPIGNQRALRALGSARLAAGSECTAGLLGRPLCGVQEEAEVRSVFCLPNARWSRKFACPLKSRAYCEHPADSHHLSFECPKFVNSGSNCSVSCQAKGYDVVYENKRADSR